MPWALLRNPWFHYQKLIIIILCHPPGERAAGAWYRRVAWLGWWQGLSCFRINGNLFCLQNVAPAAPRQGYFVSGPTRAHGTDPVVNQAGYMHS